MQEKTKEMDGALTNNMEEYRTQKKAREKRLMAYAEEIQKNTLQMSSALIEELVAERKYQKKTQQDIADITGILPANIARFENGSRVPTLVVLSVLCYHITHRIPCAELLQQISLSITILTACSNGMTNTSISSVASKCCPLTLSISIRLTSAVPVQKFPLLRISSAKYNISV